MFAALLLDHRLALLLLSALVIGAAMAWAVCNLIARAAGRVDALGFMVWSSPFAAVPLWIISLLQNGPQQIGASLAHAGLGPWLAVAWQAAGNTLFGYGVWNWLLARHDASTVTPTATPRSTPKRSACKIQDLTPLKVCSR